MERFIALRNSGWFAGSTTFALGGDLRTFHTAAWLAVNGRGDIIYEPALFQAALGPDAAAYGPMGNPPPLIALMAPLGWLSFESAWFVLAAVSIGAVAIAFLLMGRRRWLIAAVASLLFAPVYYAITFGQLSALWLLTVAGIYYLLRKDRILGAGVVGGLLVMKPQLAIGLAIWWLVDWRRYWRAVLGAVGSAAALLGMSYIILPETWASYSESLSVFVSMRDIAATQWAQFSVWSFWDLLLPGGGATATVLGAASSLGVAIVSVFMLRRCRGNLRASMSIAVLATVLGAPHLVAYDWTLLLVPAVLLWELAGDQRDRFVLSAAAVVAAGAWGVALSNAMLDAGNFAIQIAPLVLLVAVAIQLNNAVSRAEP
jgi:hypothetical protein